MFCTYLFETVYNDISILNFNCRRMIITQLTEVTRSQLITKLKSSAKGKQRFDRRNKSKVANTTAAMNKIDMNKLFTEDILSVGIPVRGETDDYVVTISFVGFLELLQDEISKSDNLSFREISRAAIKGFNKDDVYINCSCPDFAFRYAYVASKNNYNSGARENRPANITNPNDSLGSGCKHTLLVLNNTSYMIRVARAIDNYIKYMQRHYPKMYADIIYPAIYGEEYVEPVQTTFDDTDELKDTSDVIDQANIERKDSTKFKPNNQSGVQFARKDASDEDQLVLDDIL